MLDNSTLIHYIIHVKTITVNVSEQVYEAFQQFARKMDRKTSELIREALEQYRQQHMERRTSLRDRHPASVGGPIDATAPDDDIPRDMLKRRK